MFLAMLQVHGNHPGNEIKVLLDLMSQRDYLFQVCQTLMYLLHVWVIVIVHIWVTVHVWATVIVHIWVTVYVWVTVIVHIWVTLHVGVTV